MPRIQTLGRLLLTAAATCCIATMWCDATTCCAVEPIDVTFKARIDGSEQRYLMVPPADWDRTKPTHVLIALHGHGSDRKQFVENPRDECRAVRDAAAQYRMILISPDYRAKTSWMGPKAEADLLQILDELKAKYAVGKIVLCGGSMGGSSALTFAAMHPDSIHGVVAFNGTANHLEYEQFQDAICESFGGTKTQIPAEYKKRSAEYYPERLTMPSAVTTGGRDTAVPPDSVLRLASILEKIRPGNTLRIHRPATGHETNYADCREALRFVLERVLPK